MTDDLALLAREAGIAVKWRDASGLAKRVSPDVLRAVLAALGLAAHNAGDIRDSRARLRENSLRPLTIAKPGDAIAAPGRRVRFLDEFGASTDLAVRDGKANAPDQPGYYRFDGETRRVAVVPDRATALPARKVWGIAAQLYALQGGTTPGFGDFAALGDFVERAGVLGASAVAISPVHALFGARPAHISPYSPSSRLFLNPLYAATGQKLRGKMERLIDWRAAARQKLAALRRDFAAFQRGRDSKAEFESFVRDGGKRLLAHARFEILDARFGGRHWRDWPAEFRDGADQEVSASDPQIAFQLFLQWRAEESLAAAQARAKAGGMAIGLITDMAVGMDPAGSHAWSAPDEVLRGLSIGAPPDVYNQAGQNWGLTNFSPQGLRAHGYGGFLDTLRAAMRHAGGIRLDHAMGLKRLWVIPDGAAPGEGAYLTYPFEEMLGLLALESRRHNAVVIAEDLGTVPPGFRARIARAGLSGMKVLWFERDRRGAFLPPQKWDRRGAALSTTHDLPTLAGWWCGHDIARRARIGISAGTVAAERKARARDRKALWKTLRSAGAAKGAASEAPDKFVDAVFAGLGRTPSPLTLLEVEDFIGEIEQPNIPGTIDQHPNWRRRLRLRDPLNSPAAKRRAKILRQERP